MHAPPEANPHAAVQAAADAHSAAQTAHARALRLRNLALREPMVRDLLRDHAAEIERLRTQLAETDARHSSLATEASRLAEDNARLTTDLETARTQLAAALKPKRSA